MAMGIYVYGVVKHALVGVARVRLPPAKHVALRYLSVLLAQRVVVRHHSVLHSWPDSMEY